MINTTNIFDYEDVQLIPNKSVETDHPLLSFQLPDAQRYRRPSDTSVYARIPHPSREKPTPQSSFVDSSFSTMRRFLRTSSGRSANPRNAANRMKEARDNMASPYS